MNELREKLNQQKIIHHAATGGQYSTDYLDTLRGIQYVALTKGYDITLLDADNIWEDISANSNASWLDCPLDDLEKVWDEIKMYFPDVIEENFIEGWDQHFSYDVQVNITTRREPGAWMNELTDEQKKRLGLTNK